MTKQWVTETIAFDDGGTLNGPGPFVWGNIRPPSPEGTGTLIRTLATFTASVLVTWSDTYPDLGWWMNADMAAGLFVSPPGITPGPAYKPPLGGTGAETIPWVVWTPMTVATVYENDTQNTQLITFKSEGGLLDSRAERIMAVNQGLHFTIQASNSSNIGKAFESNVSYAFGYAAYINCLFEVKP
jgi:hypothetical protein